MKERIIGVTFIIFGLFLIMYANYQKLENNNLKPIEDKKENEVLNIEKKDNNEEIINYLNNKYDNDFEIVEKIKEYCLRNTTYNLTYTDECKKNDIVNSIYKVKSSDNEKFYVKKVSYIDKGTTVPEAEESNEKEGFYDNYISYIVAKKIEDELLPQYKSIIKNNISLNIYEGIGIYDVTVDNVLQYLDKSYQSIKDKDIEIKDFADLSNDISIGVSIKKNSIITEDNFKEEVDMILRLKDIKVDGLFIDKIIVEYTNDNRYIEYDNDLKILELKKGTNIYTSQKKSNNIYDRKICLSSNKILDCITYNDFRDVSNTLSF